LRDVRIGMSFHGGAGRILNLTQRDAINPYDRLSY